MTKAQAIEELKALDAAYLDKSKDAQFWANEIRLSKTSSPYVKASHRPVLEARYEAARNAQEVIWENMVKLMDQHGIGAEHL